MSLSVCLSVCVCLSVGDHVFGTARPIFAEFFCASVCLSAIEVTRVGAIQAKRQARRTGSDRPEHWTVGIVMIVAIARVCNFRIGLSTLTGNSVDDEIRCLYDGAHSSVSVCLSVRPRSYLRNYTSEFLSVLPIASVVVQTSCNKTETSCLETKTNTKTSK